MGILSITCTTKPDGLDPLPQRLIVAWSNFQVPITQPLRLGELQIPYICNSFFAKWISYIGMLKKRPADLSAGHFEF